MTDRRRILHELAPEQWDTAPLTIAQELRDMIVQALGDADKGCDSGGGDGIADLWPWIGGREYHIQIKPSLAQTKREKS